MTIRKFQFWWTIDSLKSARQAAEQGMMAAMFVAITTAMFAFVVILFGGLGAGMPQFDARFGWGIGVFVAIAIGIAHQSRCAAVSGLVLYGTEQLVTRLTQPIVSMSDLLIALVIVIAFANSVRGTFAYHQLRRDRLR
ncbi:hypothetical protein H6F67_15630 [Microcoleus sp. FACHB-1515]|uniref:hypothetical protein n=1 Tax=Cyanophyceae TaxID=3028117 RepID=UPI0016852597|nr:hypothetical protein [Microcoleus sp. FACHB-1515]MBD2091286.1 hypothetical protein [Microcoleus sp. FACHB-1515]